MSESHLNNAENGYVLPPKASDFKSGDGTLDLEAVLGDLYQLELSLTQQLSPSEAKSGSQASIKTLTNNLNEYCNKDASADSSFEEFPDDYFTSDEEGVTNEGTSAFIEHDQNTLQTRTCRRRVVAPLHIQTTVRAESASSGYSSGSQSSYTPVGPPGFAKPLVSPFDGSPSPTSPDSTTSFYRSYKPRTHHFRTYSSSQSPTKIPETRSSSLPPPKPKSHRPRLLTSESMQNSEITEDRATMLKEEQIKIALEKIEKAAIQKRIVKTFTEDGCCKTIQIDEFMTAREVCYILLDKNHLKPGPNWVLCEYVPSLGLERFLEDHEKVIPLLLSWPRNTENILKFVERSRKYDLFFNPQRYLLEMSASKTDRDNAQYAKEQLIESFFSRPGAVPELEGVLYFKVEGRKWRKGYFVLRPSGMYIAKSKSKEYIPSASKRTKLAKCARFNNKDFTCLLPFDNFEPYYCLSPKTRLKAHTDFVLALKPRGVNVPTVKSIFYFCAQDPLILQQWVTGIRIAKHKSQLWENFQQTCNHLSEYSRLHTDHNFSCTSLLSYLNQPPSRRTSITSSSSRVTSDSTPSFDTDFDRRSDTSFENDTVGHLPPRRVDSDVFCSPQHSPRSPIQNYSPQSPSFHPQKYPSNWNHELKAELYNEEKQPSPNFNRTSTLPSKCERQRTPPPTPRRTSTLSRTSVGRQQENVSRTDGISKMPQLRNNGAIALSNSSPTEVIQNLKSSSHASTINQLKQNFEAQKSATLSVSNESSNTAKSPTMEGRVRFQDMALPLVSNEKASMDYIDKSIESHIYTPIGNKQSQSPSSLPSSQEMTNQSDIGRRNRFYYSTVPQPIVALESFKSDEIPPNDESTEDADDPYHGSVRDKVNMFQRAQSESLPLRVPIKGINKSMSLPRRNPPPIPPRASAVSTFSNSSLKEFI